MRFNAQGFKIHQVPNGGLAVLDGDNKLIAYKKTASGSTYEWDFVRADYRKS